MWEKIPFFFSILGFTGALLLSLMAKLLGKLLLLRGENYYGEDLDHD